MNMNPTLLPPSDGNFGPMTPSGLTPNARSEAEAALTLNSTAQTDSAAPVDPETGETEAQKAYRRPTVPRTSSANYEMALKRAQQASVSSDMSTDSDATGTIAGDQNVASPTGSSPFPPPGQGVVPLNYGSGVSAGQGEAIKKTRSRGLSLGALARQQSWNQEDFKRVYNADLFAEPKGEAGYGSGADKA